MAACGRAEIFALPTHYLAASRLFWPSGSSALSLRPHPRAGVTENLYRLVKLLDFQRLFQHGYRADLQDTIENFGIGIAGDDDHIEVGIDLFGIPINLVSWGVGKLKIQEHQIKFLLFQVGNRILGRSNHNPAKPNFLKEIPEQLL